MLAVKLNTPKNIDLSRSSFNDDEADAKQMKDLIEEQKRAIRKLNLKIQKLEETLKKERANGNSGSTLDLDPVQNQHLFGILKNQMDKHRQTEEVLSQIIKKIKEFIKNLSLDRFFTDNPENKTLTHSYAFKSLKNISTNQSVSPPQKHQFNGKQRFQPIFKDMVVLQTGLYILNQNYRTLLFQSQQMLTYMQKVQKIQVLYKKQLQNRKDLQRELESQRKIRLRLKGLLQKSQCQKNILLMKIDKITFNEKQFIQKKREQWVHLSKSLTLKISDLQKQKRQMYIENMRQKQKWNSKYGELLQTVRSVQLTRR